MTATNYSRGRDFEHAVRADLTVNGYDCVRSAGSRSKIDILAFKPGQALFVQCKRDGRISPLERQELRRIAAHVAAVPLVAFKQERVAAPRYAVLTGPGPRDRELWTPDQLGDPSCS